MWQLIIPEYLVVHKVGAREQKRCCNLLEHTWKYGPSLGLECHLMERVYRKWPRDEGRMHAVLVNLLNRGLHYAKLHKNV